MKNLKYIVPTCLIALGLFVLPGLTKAATIINFDDEFPAPAGSPIPTDYEGLIWNNFDSISKYSTYYSSVSGYTVAATSPSNSAFNAYANPASISAVASTTFSITSVKLTAAWNDNLQVNTVGYRNGTAVYNNTYQLSAVTPTTINLNYSNIDKIVFSSSGGVFHSSFIRNPSISGPWTQFAIDDISVTIGSLIPTATPVSPNSIKVGWTNTYPDIISLELERAVGSGAFSNILTEDPTTQSATYPPFIDTGLIPATTYSYRMRGTSKYSEVTAYSAVVKAKTSVGSLSLTTTPLDRNNIKLDWTNPYTNLSFFEVERHGTSTNTFSKVTNILKLGDGTLPTIYTDPNLIPASTYSYRVRGYDAENAIYTPYSNTVSAKTKPAATTTLTATFDTRKGYVTLNWQAIPDSYGYLVERSTATSSTVFDEFHSSSTTYNDLTELSPQQPLQPYYRVRAQLLNGYSDYSNTVTLPSTCLNIRGNGPINVIFLSGKSTKYGINELTSLVNRIVDQGFAQIDPYKKYLDQFSFYIDLNKIDESLPTAIGSSGGGYKAYDFLTGSPNPAEVLKNASTCLSGTRSKNQYAYLTDTGVYIDGVFTPGFYEAYAALQNNLLQIDLGDTAYKGQTYNLPVTFLHEFGHSFAGLLDEYVKSTSKYNPDNLVSVGKIPYGNTKNCTTQPSWDYRSTDNRIYGSVVTQGCTSLMTSIGQGSVPYYRPSENSLMKDSYFTTDSTNQMNIVGCGYVIAAIKGEELTKEDGQKHFPECATLGTVKTGVPPISPPVVNSIVPGSSVRSYNINGTGFSPTGNSIKLVNGNTPTSFLNKDNLATVSDGFFGKVRDFITSIFSSIDTSRSTAATTESLPPIAPLISITALTPATNVTWTLGQTYPITWTSTNPPANSTVKVWMKNQSTGAYYSIQNGTFTGPGSAKITLPNNGTIPAGTYSIEYRFSPAIRSTAPGVVTIIDTKDNIATTTGYTGVIIKTPIYVTAGGPYTVQAGSPVTFAGTAQNLQDSSQVVSVTWTLTGSPSCTKLTTLTPTCTYSTPGTYTASVVADIMQDSINTATVTVSAAQPTYLISNASSTDGTSLSFIVPDSVPAGTYQVYVSSNGSDYALGGQIVVNPSTTILDISNVSCSVAVASGSTSFTRIGTPTGGYLPSGSPSYTYNLSYKIGTKSYTKNNIAAKYTALLTTGVTEATETVVAPLSSKSVTCSL